MNVSVRNKLSKNWVVKKNKKIEDHLWKFHRLKFITVDILLNSIMY